MAQLNLSLDHYSEIDQPADVESTLFSRLSVGLVCLDVSQSSLRMLAQSLSKGELERAGRFRSKCDMRRYIVTRSTLRYVLAARLGIARSDIRFHYGTHGKPTIANCPLAFNVSHSGERALIAVGNVHSLGVDVELVRPRSRFEALADSVLCSGERAVFCQKNGEEQVAFFYRCWTAKEACVKAVGLGLSVAPSSLEVIWANSYCGAVNSNTLPPMPVIWPHLADGYIAAVTVLGEQSNRNYELISIS